MSAEAFLMLGMALAPGLASSAPACQARSGAGTGALIELYTSEGCSSCPPADRWFGQLAATADPRNLSLLAFHVDYWDEIGWPDRFAQHAYTVRQGQRVRAGGSTTVYTPQVMVSSQLRLRWNQADMVAAAVAKIQRKPASLALRLRARPESTRWLVDVDALTVAGTAGGNGQMYLALYENAMSSHVKAGENAGVTLRHERVVRGLWGPWPLSAAGATRQLRVTPAPGSGGRQLGLTAFVQDPRTGETTQALSLPLDACPAEVR